MGDDTRVPLAVPVVQRTGGHEKGYQRITRSVGRRAVGRYLLARMGTTCCSTTHPCTPGQRDDMWYLRLAARRTGSAWGQVFRLRGHRTMGRVPRAHEVPVQAASPLDASLGPSRGRAMIHYSRRHLLPAAATRTKKSTSCDIRPGTVPGPVGECQLDVETGCGPGMADASGQATPPTRHPGNPEITAESTSAWNSKGLHPQQ